jgi:hypothetical protein
MQSLPQDFPRLHTHYDWYIKLRDLRHEVNPSVAVHKLTVGFKLTTPSFEDFLYNCKNSEFVYGVLFVCILFADLKSDPDFIYFIFKKNMID